MDRLAVDYIVSGEAEFYCKSVEFHAQSASFSFLSHGVSEAQTVISFASVPDGGFSVLLCVVCFVLVSSYLKHSMCSVKFSLPASFLSPVFTDS